MPAVSKKTAKTRRVKAPKKALADAAPAFEAPVLFRLRDLTEVHFVSAEPAIQYTSAVLEHSEPPTKLIAQPSEPSKKPNALKRAASVGHYVALAAKSNLAGALLRVARIPYAAPTGLLGVSLLATLGLIYVPWGGAKTEATQAMESSEKTDSPLPAAPSKIVDTDHSAPSVETDIADHSAHRPLRKIADRLDQQLAESESPNVSSAGALESDPPPETDSAEKADAFTEPWWRTRPAGHRGAAQVAANEADEALTDADEESKPELVDEPIPEERVVSPRTAMRKRVTEERTDDRDSESEEVARPRRQNRFTEQERDESKGSRNLPSNAQPEVDGAESDVTESPWKRIRNERVDREPAREEPVAKKPSKKSQYRSPPGQDIDLSSDWPSETASRPRTEPKRNGVR